MTIRGRKKRKLCLLLLPRILRLLTQNVEVFVPPAQPPRINEEVHKMAISVEKLDSFPEREFSTSFEKDEEDAETQKEQTRQRRDFHPFRGA